MRAARARRVVVEPGRSAYELGPFVVRFIPSRHSKLLFGRKVPFDGPLTCEDVHGLAPAPTAAARSSASASRSPASASTTRAAPTSTTTR